MLFVVEDRKEIGEVQLSLAGVVTATAAPLGIIFETLTHVAICLVFQLVHDMMLAAARENPVD